MWAPADLFTPFLNTFLFPLKRGVTYFYEHPMVLAATVLAIGLLIAIVTLIGNRRARRT